MGISELKFKEISLFLDLMKAGSIRELARQKNVEPGQISKSLRSLELKLGTPLLERTTKGVHRTARAQELQSTFEELMEVQQKLEENRKLSSSSVLTIATTSFFSTHFVPKILGNLIREEPGIHCELLELPPSQFIPVALRHGFDICLHQGELDWPRTWTSILVGEIQWNLYARRRHELSERKATLAQVLKNPFTYPIYWTNEGKRYGDDSFPISIKKRIRGIETATAASAAQIIANSDQIGYLPSPVAQNLVKHRQLSVIEVQGLKPIRQPVFLSVKSDTIKQKRYEWFQKETSLVCREYS